MNKPSRGKADLNRSNVARYIQLATLFRRRIESGQWAPGEQIPTVEDLAAQFDVARATIRQSVGVLEDEGLVSRFRAKGTFVNKRDNNRLWCEVETDWQGMLSSREGATIEILADTSGASPPRPPHDIGEFAPSYRHLRRRHSQGGKVFLIADVYIDERLAKKIPKAAFTTKTALRLAASLPGVQISAARQTLTVGAADIEVAGLLDLPLNAPICHVVRSAADQHNRVVLLSYGDYRGDVVRFDMKVK